MIPYITALLTTILILLGIAAAAGIAFWLFVHNINPGQHNYRR